MSEVAVADATSSTLPSVRDVLLERLDRSSVPGYRDDDYRLVVAVEGGGMRGAVSSGMLLALEQLGLRNSVDVVVGTSAGAIAGAFFATSQGTSGSVLYYTVLNSERFLNPKRLMREGSVLDLDYLINEALDRHGFNWDDLINSDIPVWATVTPVDADNPRRIFRVGENEAHARRVLAATACLPVMAGPSRFVDDKEYVDGGMFDAVPWSSAIGFDATHVLVIRSRGFNDGKPEPLNRLERATVPRLVKRMHGEYVSDVVSRSSDRFFRSTEALRAVIEGRGTPVIAGGRDVRIEVVLPPKEVDLPERLEVDTHLLMDALAGGAQAMLEYLHLEGFRVEQRVVVNHPRAPVGKVRTSALAPIVSNRRRQTR